MEEFKNGDVRSFFLLKIAENLQKIKDYFQCALMFLNDVFLFFQINIMFSAKKRRAT